MRFAFCILVAIFPIHSFAQTGESLRASFQSELSKCENTKKQAELCCGNPVSCAGGLSPQAKQQMMQLLAVGGAAAMSMMSSGSGGMSKEGIAGICGALSALGGAGANVNQGTAKICDDERGRCSSTCSSLAGKWEQKKSQCGEDCADKQIIDDALAELQSRQQTCDGLQANSQAMQQQAQQTGGAGGIGEICSMLAGMMPSSEEKQAQTVIDCNQPANYANPLCIDCKLDPENPQCGKPAEDGKSNLGYASTSDLSEASFDTGMMNDGLNQGPKFGGYAPGENRSGTVSGQGGAIMGGGNNGGGFGSEPQGNSEAEGYNTDILAGERGGGGYSVAAGGVDSSGGFSGYGSGGGGTPEEEMPYAGMDLKNFLPGGAMDPSRRIAGALVNAGQINGKSEDIFQRITMRIKAVCLTNRLKDCGKRN